MTKNNQMIQPQLIIAKEIGFCYGVRDAFNKVIDESKSLGTMIQSYGPIIHNEKAIQSLKTTYNIESVENFDQIKTSHVAIRAHGATPQVYKELEKRNCNIIDTTCPFVKKTRKLALALIDEGYFVVILGKKKHPEIIGIAGHLGDQCYIIQSQSDLDSFKQKRKKKVGIVFQSTVTVDDFSSILVQLVNYAREIKIRSTICDVTQRRQEEIKLLAKKVDFMIVIGGKNSSNTKKLVEISQRLGADTIHIEQANETKSIRWKEKHKIGLISGTSTPTVEIESLIKEIQKQIPTLDIVSLNE